MYAILSLAGGDQSLNQSIVLIRAEWTTVCYALLRFVTLCYAIVSNLRVLEERPIHVVHFWRREGHDGLAEVGMGRFLCVLAVSHVDLELSVLYESLKACGGGCAVETRGMCGGRRSGIVGRRKGGVNGECARGVCAWRIL